MKNSLTILLFLLMGVSAVAQTQPVSATAQAKPALTTPPSVVTLIEGVTGKHFLPDTAYAALSEEDETLLAKVPLANWSLLQESGKEMAYSNLVIGTRSYQLVIIRPAKTGIPVATLLRFVTAQSKPEPIARGTLQPKEEKPK